MTLKFENFGSSGVIRENLTSHICIDVGDREVVLLLLVFMFFSVTFVCKLRNKMSHYNDSRNYNEMHVFFIKHSFGFYILMLKS